MGHNFKDEFNDVKVTNNRDPFASEFAQNKNTEYFKSQNSNPLPKDEFSSKNNASIHSNNNENLKRTIEKAVETSSEATTVVSTATASSVAATSSSVVVAASTVAVVTIGAVVGISAMGPKYEYQFNSFLVSANELTYELFLKPAGQEGKDEEEWLSYEDFEENKEKKSQTFSLRVYNKSYDYTHELYLGYNYDTFSNLTLGETYNIVLTEDGFGGDPLYKDTFTTFTNTKFNSFSIPGSANFVENTFDVSLNYSDNNHAFSDFTLYLEDVEFPEELYATYTLQEKSGIQQVNATNAYGESLNLRRTYNYYFSYKHNEETIEFDQGQVSFYDTSGAVSKFNYFNINNVVDFDSYYFDVQLDYVDELKEMDSFYLNLTDTSTNEETYIYLDKTTEPQTIDIRDYSIDFINEYAYTLTYYDNNDSVEAESGVLKFEDIQGRQCKFNDLIIEANFANDEVVFTLDYVDDLNRFDNFVLTLDMVEDTSSTTIELSPTTSPQPKNIMEYDINFEYSYTYTLTADYLNNQKTLIDHTEPYVFTDASNGQSSVNGIMFIGGEAKYSDRSFDVKLEYEDDFNWLDEFVLEIDDLTNNGHLDVPLNATTDEQTVFANEMRVNEDTGSNEYVVDIVSHELKYNVHYSKKGETLYLYEESQDLSFNNEEFLGIDCSNFGFAISGNVEDGYRMGMKFNFRENAERYSEIYPVLYNESGNVAEVIINSDSNPQEWNYFDVVAYGDTQLLTDLIGGEARLVVNANIFDQANDYVSEEVIIYDQTISLLASEDLEPEIYGVCMDEYVIGSMYEANMRSALFTSTTSYFDDCTLVLTSLESGRTYSYDFYLSDSPISFIFSSPSSGTFDETEFQEDLSYPFKIELIYYVYVESREAGSSGPTMVKTGPNTFVCYESFKFTLSV